VHFSLHTIFRSTSAVADSFHTGPRSALPKRFIVHYIGPNRDLLSELRFPILNPAPTIGLWSPRLSADVSCYLTPRDYPSLALPRPHVSMTAYSGNWRYVPLTRGLMIVLRVSGSISQQCGRGHASCFVAFASLDTCEDGSTMST